MIRIHIHCLTNWKLVLIQKYTYFLNVETFSWNLVIWQNMRICEWVQYINIDICFILSVIFTWITYKPEQLREDISLTMKMIPGSVLCFVLCYWLVGQCEHRPRCLSLADGSFLCIANSLLLGVTVATESIKSQTFLIFGFARLKISYVIHLDIAICLKFCIGSVSNVILNVYLYEHWFGRIQRNSKRDRSMESAAMSLSA